MSEAQEKAWLLVKRDLYFRPNAQGYTGIRDHAGLYTYDDAKSYVHEGVTMVHLSKAPEFTEACYAEYARDHLLKQRDALLEKLAMLREMVRNIEEGDDPMDVLEDMKDLLKTSSPPPPLQFSRQNREAK